MDVESLGEALFAAINRDRDWALDEVIDSEVDLQTLPDSGPFSLCGVSLRRKALAACCLMDGPNGDLYRGAF